jgi:hypothetical protein
MKFREVDTAIQNAFDGILDENKYAELREILKSSAIARVHYLQHASLHQILTYRLRSRPFKVARRAADASLKAQRQRNARLAMTVAALVVICSGLALGLFVSG